MGFSYILFFYQEDLEDSQISMVGSPWEKLSIVNNSFTISLVLTLLEGTQGFVVYYDASRVGLCFVLIENDKVIPYASIKLKVHENYYPTHDIELTTVFFSLKI